VRGSSPALRISSAKLLPVTFPRGIRRTRFTVGISCTNGLVFTTKTGRPIEPRNLVRSFHRIRSAHGLRLIKLHHLRHTTATLLKDLGVPARDAQLILGHSRLAVTQEIYTHEDRQAQHDALTKISAALRNDRRTAQ
jgi:integrase